MILRVLTLVLLVASLAFPALARPLRTTGCPSQVAVDVCHAPSPAGIASTRKGPDLPCSPKALPCDSQILPAAGGAITLPAFADAGRTWTDRGHAPPERPPRM